MICDQDWKFQKLGRITYKDKVWTETTMKPTKKQIGSLLSLIWKGYNRTLGSRACRSLKVSFSLCGWLEQSTVLLTLWWPAIWDEVQGLESEEDEDHADDQDEEERRPGQHGSEGWGSPSPVELPSSHWSKFGRCKASIVSFLNICLCLLDPTWRKSPSWRSRSSWKHKRSRENPAAANGGSYLRLVNIVLLNTFGWSVYKIIILVKIKPFVNPF